MDPKQDNPDRIFLELTVTEMARRAMQLPPGERYAFIMEEIIEVRVAYEKKHGRHGNILELDRKLQAWAQTLVKLLEKPGGTIGHA
jgi:hypothetical protein